jgi:hypothetical protein
LVMARTSSAGLKPGATFAWYIPASAGLPGFAVDVEAIVVVEVEGVGFADWRARLAPGLRWRWSGWRGVGGLGGLCWSKSGGGEWGFVDGRWGRIVAGSFATLRMTG